MNALCFLHCNFDIYSEILVEAILNIKYFTSISVDDLSALV